MIERGCRSGAFGLPTMVTLLLHLRPKVGSNIPPLSFHSDQHAIIAEISFCQSGSGFNWLSKPLVRPHSQLQPKVKTALSCLWKKPERECCLSMDLSQHKKTSHRKCSPSKVDWSSLFFHLRRLKVLAVNRCKQEISPGKEPETTGFC